MELAIMLRMCRTVSQNSSAQSLSSQELRSFRLVVLFALILLRSFLTWFATRERHHWHHVGKLGEGYVNCIYIEWGRWRREVQQPERVGLGHSVHLYAQLSRATVIARLSHLIGLLSLYT